MVDANNDLRKYPAAHLYHAQAVLKVKCYLVLLKFESTRRWEVCNPQHRNGPLRDSFGSFTARWSGMSLSSAKTNMQGNDLAYGE